MTRAGAVGDAAVEGNANDADVHVAGLLTDRCAEEGGDPGVAGMRLWILKVLVFLGMLDHQPDASDSMVAAILPGLAGFFRHFRSGPVRLFPSTVILRHAGMNMVGGRR